MTLATLSAMLGKTYNLHVEGFIIEVIVKDAKVSYGQERALVCPVQGSGLKWVSIDRLISR